MSFTEQLYVLQISSLYIYCSCKCTY